MVSSEVITGLVGVFGTALGYSIKYIDSRKSAEEASKRIFEKRVADSKFERLEELHDNLRDCVDKFGDVIFQAPDDVEDYNERVRNPYDDFVESFERAKVHLSPEDIETIENARENLNEIRTDLRVWAQDIDDDWPGNSFGVIQYVPKDVEEVAEPVYGVVRKNLDPES